MLERLLRPAVAGPVLLLLAFVCYQVFLAPSPLPDLPIIGAKANEWFPFLRAKWRNTLDYKTAVKTAHTLYRDRPVILPVYGLGNVVVLPSSDAQWVADQPEDRLSLHDYVVETLQLEYTIKDPNLVHKPAHHQIIMTKLTSQVEHERPLGYRHGKMGSNLCMGDGTSCCWRSTNRAIVGETLCRNPKLVDAGMLFAIVMMPVAQLLRTVWAPLRPLAALVISIPSRISENRFNRVVKTEIQRRLWEYDAQHGTEKALVERPSGGDPMDFLQWSIDHAKKAGDPYLFRWQTIAGRLLILNLASIHNSSFTITHAILDLVSSKQEYIDEIRNEITTVLGAHGGRWNKKALAEMHKLDSALRESLRLNSFMVLSMGRIVSAATGITTPSGVHLQRGVQTGSPTYTVLHDESIYEHAHEYRPFRFAKLRHKEHVQYTKRARNAFSATSNDYLVWGHGRGACIGRFFAANNLKLILGYAVLNYDFVLLEERPRNVWFSFYRTPPMDARITIKRRRPR